MEKEEINKKNTVKTIANLFEKKIEEENYKKFKSTDKIIASTEEVDRVTQWLQSWIN